MNFKAEVYQMALAMVLNAWLKAVQKQMVTCRQVPMKTEMRAF